MLLRRAKPVAFLDKTIGSNNSFTLIENNFCFLDNLVEFNVTVHYIWSMEKCIQLSPLKLFKIFIVCICNHVGHAGDNICQHYDYPNISYSII